MDSLTVALPGGQSPPVICGYNTGQHMFVPASDQCNSINIDIDTGTTTTIRKWQIKVKSRNLSKIVLLGKSKSLSLLCSHTGLLCAR